MKSIIHLLVCLVLCAHLFAQTPDTATIRGQVVDQTHAAISGVEVLVVNKATGFERKAQTDSSGNFSISGLPVVGTYDLTASKQGFAPVEQHGLALAGGSTADVDLQLSAAGGRTEIVVTGTEDTVAMDEVQIGTHLSAEQIEEVPLPNRRITFLPLLNAANRPAISQGDVFMNQDLFTTNGTGRRQAWFEVDGTNGVDAWGRQTIFTNLQVDDLAEMNVISNSISAEYGRTAGSVLNIVTKSGINRYHGDLIGNWRPADAGASLSGFSPSANGNFIKSDSLRQAAAAFSGPIGAQQQTHFFLSSEYSWQDRISPILSSLAPGNFEGHYRDWLALFRIDHQINSKHSLFFRSNLDLFHDTNPNGAVGGQNLPSVDRIFKRRTYSTAFGETAVLSPTMVNNLRLQFQLASPITEFDPVVFGTQFVVPIQGNSTFTTGTSQSALLQNRQYEVNDTLSLIMGRHSIKFGGDMIRAHTGGNGKEFGGPIYLGSFKYNTCQLDVASCESSAYLDDIANVASYTQSFGNAAYTVDDTLWSLFVQDDFHVRRDLTFNLGMRYERQTFTDSNKNFAPRVGFSYNLHGDGKNVFRGSFGIFYSQIVDNSQANYALTGPTGVFNFTATPGTIGFPTSIEDAPLPEFPPGAPVPLRSLYIRPGKSSYYDQFFPTSTLRGYQSGLWSPYTEQWTFGFEHQLAEKWVLSLDYVGSHTVKINRPLDVDPPDPYVRTAQGQSRSPGTANCERPYWVDFYEQNGFTCGATGVPVPAYSTILADVNNGVATYHALDVNLNRRFSKNLSLLASYTWSHAIDNVDPDIPGQNPNDPNFTGKQEIGPAIFDQRHRFVLSGVYVAPLKISLGGVATMATGLPFNIVTGSTNSGDTGATTDRPVVNGVVIPRNAGRGRSIYDVSPFIERTFGFGTERFRLNLRAEAFNVFNHPNFVGYIGTYGNGNPPANLGAPAQGITNQLPARSMQFSAKLSF